MTDYQKLIRDTIDEEAKRGFKFTSDWFHGGIRYDIDVSVSLDTNTSSTSRNRGV